MRPLSHVSVATEFLVSTGKNPVAKRVVTDSELLAAELFNYFLSNIRVK